MENRSWNISIRNLSGGYASEKILQDISADFPSGKITTILGESGCGKTTLLRMLLGLNTPSQGKIFIGETDILSLNDRQFRKMRRKIGVLFQDGALISSLSVAENTALPLLEHTRLSPKLLRETAIRTLALVGLEKYADFYPAELSGGMKKRAGLARAIVTEPPILFCDEPTSGLDPITAAQMDQLLIDMKNCYPGMTIIVVTHDLGSVDHIAENIIVLRKGKLHFSGTKQQFSMSEDDYLKRFTNRCYEESRRMTAPPLDSSVRTALADWLEK